MTTLGANVSSSETVWTLATPLSASPGDTFQVGDELVEFGAYTAPTTWGKKSHKLISVTRGVGGSAAASHLSGVTLTPVDLAWSGSVPPVAGGGGGVQQVSLLGPVQIAFDTPGLNNPSDLGPELLAVTAGVLFLPIVTINESWDQPGQLQVNAGEGTNSSNMLTIGTFDLSETYPGSVLDWVNREAYPATGAAGNLSKWMRAVQDIVVCAAFYPDAADPTAGAATVLLMTMTPA